ncbi:F-actin-capping protein subunit alpha-2 [Dirofilaria immitis]|nr:F-actin-capping protein subunit alpha-2 [Dirofilaria immitis]
MCVELLYAMLEILKGRINIVQTRRSRHILYGRQNISKSINNQTEQIQKKIVEQEKITHRSIIGGREVLWSNTSDYMKTNKAHEQLRKVLTACAVIMAINRRRKENMNEREMQRKELNLSGKERHKIGKPFLLLCSEDKEKWPKKAWSVEAITYGSSPISSSFSSRRVFNDVRMLLNNDTLLKNGCAAAFAQYNKEQFIPVKLESVDKQTLITPFNEMSNGRFYDPRSRNSFKYEHLRKEAVDIQAENANDVGCEPWRKAVQEEADKYIESHYEDTGIAAVFVNNGSLTLCIESHRYQPKNFWNGRWRSQWTIPVMDGKNEQCEIKGIIKVHVHYYEDGNVQLVSTKETSAKITYADAVQENYQQMSATTFKALRRQLPVTGVKFDWNNTHTYRISKDLKPQ